MDIAFPVSWSTNTLMDVCTAIMFIGVPTSLILRYNENVWQEKHKKLITRRELSAQLLLLFLTTQMHERYETFPEIEEIMQLFEKYPTYLENLLQAISHERHTMLQLSESDAHYRHSHSHQNALTIRVVLRDVLPPSEILKELRVEHTMYNHFLLSSSPLNKYIRENEAGMSHPIEHKKKYSTSVIPHEAFASDFNVKSVLATPQHAEAQRHLLQELQEEMGKNGFAVSLVNLQVLGFLNPDAKPRPNISSGRIHFWGIRFTGFNTTDNLMGTILCAVAVQYNAFVRQHHDKKPSEIHDIRIGHICKSFRKYGEAHNLLCTSLSKYHRNPLSSIKLRYNQLIANFRMYLRKKFPKNWSSPKNTTVE